MKMRKEGHARGFTVYCDEGQRVGGENAAPPLLGFHHHGQGHFFTLVSKEADGGFAKLDQGAQMSLKIFQLLLSLERGLNHYRKEADDKGQQN
jgi:hypothetical protein